MSELFNNPMVERARKAMTKEQLKHYEMLGESMYKDIDFENCTSNMPPFMNDALKQLESLIKSGYHPSMMDKDEIRLLEEAYGDKWYELFGFVEGDLTDFVTLKF